MRFKFESNIPQKPWSQTTLNEWSDWKWQMRNALKSTADFESTFILSSDEQLGLKLAPQSFKVSATPYYANLAHRELSSDPIRRIFMPSSLELEKGRQAMIDPLGEHYNQTSSRIIHRYSDRVLFWITDTCGLYCRYCLRKHFTAQGHAIVDDKEIQEALKYISSHTGIREVILSGGDPLTVSDQYLDRILSELRQIDHIEIIRIGTRMPVVNPMRITLDLVKILKKANPVYVMTHFNHPRELTLEAFEALTQLVDSGIPVFNQMVLLNGVNNHPAIVQALSRRLLFARVKPYYMFQCDPSEGTDHLRTTIEDSLAIQKELWGHLSGLAMPILSLDIPKGGGKVSLVPDFQIGATDSSRTYVGWDGVRSEYINPDPSKINKPIDFELYLDEWESLKSAKLSQV